MKRSRLKKKKKNKTKYSTDIRNYKKAKVEYFIKCESNDNKPFW